MRYIQQRANSNLSQHFTSGVPASFIKRCYSATRLMPESSILIAQLITSLQILCLQSLAKSAHQIAALLLIRFPVLCVGVYNSSVVLMH